MTAGVTIHQGDVMDVLRTMPDNSVHCVVTSPPYWGLRDYGVSGQIGLEPTPEEYVTRMVEVFREVRRVLRPDGTLWLNMGDSYAGSGKGAWSRDDVQKEVYVPGVNGEKILTQTPGLKPKDLVGIPWRLAFALQADGWWLRQDIIWAKPNPMPESVTDRCTKSHEYLFLLTKAARYYYDAEAIREPIAESTLADGRNSTGRHTQGKNESKYFNDESPDTAGADKPSWYRAKVFVNSMSGRNRRSVWTIATAPYKEAHFATFPPKLVEPCILAGTSERGCCPECGKPWARMVEKSGGAIGKSWHDHQDDEAVGQRAVNEAKGGHGYKVKTLGWRPGCECGHKEPVPCTVLDPFGGSGTVGEVAINYGRSAILIELNPAYVELAHKRLAPSLEMARQLRAVL